MWGLIRRCGAFFRRLVGLGASGGVKSNPEGVRDAQDTCSYCCERAIARLSPTVVVCYHHSYPSNRGDCPDCYGTGYFMPGQRDCPTCFGSGMGPERRFYRTINARPDWKARIRE